jgi:hypothetical protein
MYFIEEAYGVCENVTRKSWRQMHDIAVDLAQPKNQSNKPPTVSATNSANKSSSDHLSSFTTTQSMKANVIAVLVNTSQRG